MRRALKREQTDMSFPAEMTVEGAEEKSRRYPLRKGLLDKFYKRISVSGRP